MEPMQLGLIRSPLFPEEKLCRQQDLHFYCGVAGHYLQNCPARPCESVSAPVTSSNFVKSNSTHLTLPLSLQLPGRCIQTQSIIDSGACSCFMDCTFAKQHQIPLQTKAQHLKIHLADGSNPRSGPIIHETCPLLASLSEQQKFLQNLTCEEHIILSGFGKGILNT